ncbi:hypothetical protein Cst_c17950 [Thermoclostridium stercorarium subsp. stercorarium DSM 8532]|uniref:Uncharacterized protein n=1 Tax=Thermoclostridium stercorarium (strain ATCC 35414 / DSM 8532 / NCIMB 11754) TaxID=1121335 RepID=L7VKW2_THES1|nr:hypothetical protein Cst_c17950 [Thermoclostridium stercorarium subsp. stercorarium DSM 8532]
MHGAYYITRLFYCKEMQNFYMKKYFPKNMKVLMEFQFFKG